MTRIDASAGELALAALQPFGVDTLFTLNGGHIWPFYDAARRRGVRIVDTRHEQTATWAAEAYAKLTGKPGLAVLTAGPGVTNGVSAITSASFNGAPLVVLGGRAPQARWGSGSLQELDHLPIVRSVTKAATTVTDPSNTVAVVADSARAALTPHRGPVFVDVPMDVLFATASAEVPDHQPRDIAGVQPDPADLKEAAAAIAGAERPAIITGSDVYWSRAWEPLRAAVERLRLPCFANGMGRGCLPADHELAFAHTRGLLKGREGHGGADLVVVAGTPLDFRLGFGRFGDARVVHLLDAPTDGYGTAGGRGAPVPDGGVTVAGDLTASLEGLAGWDDQVRDHEGWIRMLRDAETDAANSAQARLDSDAVPIVPTRVMGELTRRLERDAVVICDGGDFASYAGRYLPSFTPGCWLDTGPYGCLGNGLGYAIAARLARPDSQVVVVLGDGAAGFSLMDVDTLVRHRLPAVLLVGNNGIWGLEKHPMQAIYGWDVAADLQPQCRYDEVVRALGGDGELVTDPAGIGPALDRAFASELPYLVNVVTDPADAYPRQSNLG
jgi:acetolactate synthase I/II/III large subunit